MSIDSWGIGNHELYTEIGVEFIHNNVSKLSKDRYLTGNVLWNADKTCLTRCNMTVPVEGESPILVLNFMYTWKLNSANSYVRPVTTELNRAEFVNMVKNGKYLMIVALIHIDAENTETTEIVNKLKEYQPNIPILALCGHSHRMYQYSNESENVVRMVSGAFFKQFGLLQFTLSTSEEKNAIQNVSISFPETSKSSLLSLYTHISNINTTRGDAIEAAINAKFDALGLSEVLGTSPRYYTRDYSEKGEDSIYTLVVDYIYPAVDPMTPGNPFNTSFYDPNEKTESSSDNNNNTSHTNAYKLNFASFSRSKYQNTLYSKYTTQYPLKTQMVFMVNSASQRADLFKGEIIRDDVLAIDPFANTLCIFRNIDGPIWGEFLESDVESVLVAESGMTNIHNNISNINSINNTYSNSLLHYYSPEEESELEKDLYYSFSGLNSSARLTFVEDMQKKGITIPPIRLHSPFHSNIAVQNRYRISEFFGDNHTEYINVIAMDIVTTDYDCVRLNATLAQIGAKYNVNYSYLLSNVTSRLVLENYISRFFGPQPPEDTSRTPFVQVFLIIILSVSVVTFFIVLFFIQCHAMRKAIKGLS